MKILMAYLMECHWVKKMVFKDGFYDVFIIGIYLYQMLDFNMGSYMDLYLYY